MDLLAIFLDLCLATGFLISGRPLSLKSDEIIKFGRKRVNCYT